MKRSAIRFLAVCFAAAALLAAGATESQAYFGLKGGLFMPNSDDEGLKGFDNGPTGELFFGFALGPADLEFGLGGYQVKPENDAADITGTAAWLTGTLKAHLPVGPLSLYGGGGAGFYAATFLDPDDITSEDIDEQTGQGVGFHAVGGAEFSLGILSILAEVKWVTVKIDFDPGKIQMGGLTANVGILF